MELKECPQRKKTMKKQYKVWWIGRDNPGQGIRTIYAESEKEAMKIARKTYPRVDIIRSEVLK